MAISDWPASERPRERLIRQGPAALSDAELLALFLRVGIPGKDAVALARDALTRFGSLHALLQASPAEFSTVPGLGAAKYSQLQAALELARRTIAERLQDGHVLSSPQAVREFLTLRLRNKPYEAFHVLFLDVKNRLIDARELFRGTLTQP
jgi:DNA repair protein RadC